MRSSKARSIVALTIPLAAASLALTALAAQKVVVPLKCSKGPSDQRYTPTLTLPSSVVSGETYGVRIDGAASGEVSHVGLNYIFNMTYDYLVPTGTSLVDGSLRIVPGTGSANVRANARVSHKSGVITLMLPGHVENGSTYTPPSFEFKLKVSAPSGASIVHKFAAYRVTANAFLVGDVKTLCDPKPKPFTVATVKVTGSGP